MHFEFRAEFFNILNHVNYLFSQFGAISTEPTALELDPNNINTQQKPRARLDIGRQPEPLARSNWL